MKSRKLRALTKSAIRARVFVCPSRPHMGWTVQRMMQSAAMGGMLGAGGVIAGSLIQAGRLPPRSQIGAAAAMMATVLGVGSVVRS